MNVFIFWATIASLNPASFFADPEDGLNQLEVRVVWQQPQKM